MTCAAAPPSIDGTPLYTARTAAGGGLHLRIGRSGAWVVVQAEGELDIATRHAFDAVLHQLIVGKGMSLVAVDLAGLRFVDSSGVKVLLNALRWLRRVDGELCVLDASPAADRLISMFDLGRFLSRAPAA